MRIPRFNDPPLMPGTGESPEACLARALRLKGTPGEGYVERRGVPVEMADMAGVRFDPDFNGRPAVLAAMRDRTGRLTSLHGRYLHAKRHENKMLTIGERGGAVSVLDGWRAEHLIVVEGLFDALSLGVCGWASVATVGRWTPWLADVAAGRVVWIAFDAGRPGETEAMRIMTLLRNCTPRRLPPLPRCKDWNNALVKRGRAAITRWVSDHIESTTL